MFPLFCFVILWSKSIKLLLKKKNQRRPAAEARTNYFNRQGIVWVCISVLKSQSFCFRSWQAATLFSKGFEQSYNYTHSLHVCTHQPPSGDFQLDILFFVLVFFEYELKQILILCFVFKSLPTVFLGFCLLLLSFEQWDIKWRKERSRKW